MDAKKAPHHPFMSGTEPNLLLPYIGRKLKVSVSFIYRIFTNRIDFFQKFRKLSNKNLIITISFIFQ